MTDTNWNPAFVAGVNAAAEQIRALQAENERLRAALTQIAGFPNPYSDQSCDQMLSEAKELAREALQQERQRKATDQHAELQVNLAECDKHDVEDQHE